VYIYILVEDTNPEQKHGGSHYLSLFLFWSHDISYVFPVLLKFPFSPKKFGVSEGAQDEEQ